MSTFFRLSAVPFLPVIAVCMFAVPSTQSAAGQSKNQLRIKATVVGQCTVRIDPVHPRTLSCAGSQLQPGKDMHIQWEESSDSPHVLRATVSF